MVLPSIGENMQQDEGALSLVDASQSQQSTERENLKGPPGREAKELGLNRGHLVPKGDFDTDWERELTMDFKNVVPQKKVRPTWFRG